MKELANRKTSQNMLDTAAREFLVARIVELEEYIESINSDNLVALYNSLNFQLGELSKDLAHNYIPVTSKTDRTFERVWKAMVDSKEVAQNLLWLKKELKIGQGADGQSDAQEPKKIVGRNPVHEFVKQQK